MLYRTKIIAFASFLFFLSHSLIFAFGTGELKSSIKITSGTAGAPVILDNDFFAEVANIGDLDNDGVNDIAVGAAGDDTGGNRRGAVHILFMNNDGSIKSTAKIASGTANGPTLANNDEYGGLGPQVAGIGDLDNDGIPDIAVGAARDDTGGVDRGAIYIHFMNTNGSIKSTTKIADGTTNGPTIADSDRYGISVGAIGDLDNEGIPDIGVGAYSDNTGGTDRGAFYIHFMNRNGSIKSTVKISSLTPNGPVLNNSFFYGDTVANIGDLDNDGIQDLAVGSFESIEAGTRGTLFIHFMNRDGSIKSTVPITSLTPNGPLMAAGDWYGSSATGTGDLNNDGIPDIAVGANFDDTGASNRGAFYIHFMNRDGSIKSSVKIGEGTTNGPVFSGTGSGNGSRYGNALTNLGDLNNDGVIDLAVGALNEEPAQKGSIYIHFLTPTPGVTISKTSLSATEGSTTDYFTFKLNSKPISDVAVSLGSNTAQTTLNSSSLTFTSANWNTPQTVVVTAVDDSNVEGSHNDNILFTLSSVDSSYNAFSVSSIPVTITDNDSRRSHGPRYLIPPITSNTNQETKKIESIVEKAAEVKRLVFTKTLKFRSNDNQVLLLQKFLNEKGYIVAKTGVGSIGKETSYFGKATQNALIRFQKANYLTPNGITDIYTREVLNK